MLKAMLSRKKSLLPNLPIMNLALRGHLVWVFLLNFISCTEEAAENMARTLQQTTTRESLLRSWQSPCLLDSNLQLFSQDSATFSEGGKILYQRQLGLQANCQSPMFQVQSQGTYQMSSVLGDAEEEGEISLQWNTLTLRPLSQAGSDYLNESEFCGIQNWTQGQERNLLGRSQSSQCPIEALLGAETESIRLEDQRLFFRGRTFNALPSSSRGP